MDYLRIAINVFGLQFKGNCTPALCFGIPATAGRAHIPQLVVHIRFFVCLFVCSWWLHFVFTWSVDVCVKLVLACAEGPYVDKDSG